MSEQAEMNKRAARRHLDEAISQKRFDVWNDIMHENYEFHHPLVRPGRDGYREASEFFWAAFGNVRYDVHHMLAEGDYVMVHYTEHATQIAPFFGVDPGKSYHKAGFALYRFEDGRMREAWVQEDDKGFAEQLGMNMEHLA